MNQTTLKRELINSSQISFLTVVIGVAFSLRLAVVVANYTDHRFYDYHYGSHDTRISIGDDYRYNEIAVNMVEGKGFPVIFEDEPHQYDFRRPPGYLLILAAVYKICGYDVIFALLMHVVFSCFALIYFYRIARHYFSEAAARISTFLWAIYPAAVMWNLALYRESVSTFFVMFAVWRFIRLTETFSWSQAFAFGIALGFGILQESSFPVPLAVLCSGFIAYGPSKMSDGTFIGKSKEVLSNIRNRFIRKLWLSLIVVAAFGVTLSPWLMYFYTHNGTVAMSKGTDFGGGDNAYLFVFRRLAHAENPNTSIDSIFTTETLRYRLEVAKRHLPEEMSLRIDSMAQSEKVRILNELKNNPQFMSDLNETALKKFEQLLETHPEVYYGKPFGKLVIHRFLNYGLNFLPSHEPGQLVNISTLNTMGYKNSLLYYIVGWSLLLFGFVLFLVYIYHAFRKGFILFVIWSLCFLVLNIKTLSSETRYILPYQTFVFMTLGYAFSQWIEKWQERKLSNQQ